MLFSIKNFTVIVLILISSSIYGQKVFSTKYKSQSDVSVFVVKYESQCDLKVFKVDYQSNTKGNNGLWYFVDYETKADKKIFFC